MKSISNYSKLLVMAGFLILFPVLSFAQETLKEEAARRLPPVLYSLDFPETLVSGETVNIKWSVLGYHNEYQSGVILYDCSGRTNNCGTGSHAPYDTSGLVTHISKVDSSVWKYGGHPASVFEFEYSFEAPVVSATTDLVVRFGQISGEDYLNSLQPTSLLIPGNLSERYDGNTGRKIVKAVSPQTQPDVSQGLTMKQPCQNCGNPGPYDRDWFGDNTNHLGKDYPGYVGDEIIAIADGQVETIYDSIGGFGGAEPSRDGPAVLVRHKKHDGQIFFALYGHMHALSGLNDGSFVKAGDVIGTVGHYYYGAGTGTDWPHLHFGIWNGDNFPESDWGYGSVRNFIDPVPFLRDEKYQNWDE